MSQPSNHSVPNSTSTHHDDNVQKMSTLKFDVQEFLNIPEDEIVDFDTPEEFLLHFSRIGQLSLVEKLLKLRQTNEINLNINCKGLFFISI